MCIHDANLKIGPLSEGALTALLEGASFAFSLLVEMSMNPMRRGSYVEERDVSLALTNLRGPFDAKLLEKIFKESSEKVRTALHLIKMDEE